MSSTWRAYCLYNKVQHKKGLRSDLVKTVIHCNHHSLRGKGKAKGKRRGGRRESEGRENGEREERGGWRVTQ